MTQYTFVQFSTIFEISRVKFGLCRYAFCIDFLHRELSGPWWLWPTSPQNISKTVDIYLGKSAKGHFCLDFIKEPPYEVPPTKSYTLYKQSQCKMHDPRYLKHGWELDKSVLGNFFLELSDLSIYEACPNNPAPLYLA